MQNLTHVLFTMYYAYCSGFKLCPQILLFFTSDVEGNSSPLELLTSTE